MDIREAKSVGSLRSRHLVGSFTCSESRRTKANSLKLLRSASNGPMPSSLVRLLARDIRAFVILQFTNVVFIYKDRPDQRLALGQSLISVLQLRPVAHPLSPIIAFSPRISRHPMPRHVTSSHVEAKEVTCWSRRTPWKRRRLPIIDRIGTFLEYYLTTHIMH